MTSAKCRKYLKILITKCSILHTVVFEAQSYNPHINFCGEDGNTLHCASASYRRSIAEPSCTSKLVALEGIEPSMRRL